MIICTLATQYMYTLATQYMYTHYSDELRIYTIYYNVLDSHYSRCCIRNVTVTKRNYEAQNICCNAKYSS